MELDMSNHTHRTCSYDECDRKHVGHGYCAKHLYRLRTHGDPVKVIAARDRAKVGPESPSWQGDAIGYSAAHYRLRAIRGAAATYTCVGCGDQANDWAYVHDAQQELVDERGRRYSAQVDDYQPMCTPCHHAYDHPLVARCLNGHEYDLINTYVRPDGNRDCRACQLERVRAWRRRKRMAAL